jgi:hypothetical protein
MRYHRRVYIQYFFIIFFTLLLVPPAFYQLPTVGIDPSWNIALHLAHKYHLVFGKDFIFTYGPLGILYSRLPVSVSWVFYLAFDLYFLGTLFFILRDIFSRHFTVPVVLFIFLAIMAAMYSSSDQWYFFFFVYAVCAYLRSPERTGWIIQAGLLSVICFYFKVSSGIVSGFIFLCAIHYILLLKKSTLRTYLLVFLPYLFIFWAASIILRVDLAGYTASSMKLINDYNDAMFFPAKEDYAPYVRKAVIMIIVLAGCALYRILMALKRKEAIIKGNDLFLIALISLSLYIVFKSAFVRPDGHSYVFFKTISLFGGLFFLFSSQKTEKLVTAACSWLILGMATWAVNSMPGTYLPLKRAVTLSFIPIKANELGLYAYGLFHYNEAVANAQRVDTMANPFKSVIGDHTVDIVPSEIATIYFNGLHYDPRPVIQSYAAYNHYLDSLNYNKYMSASAPDYVLFNIGSIDDRFPSFDESMTKTALLNHYEVAETISGQLLLKKKQQADKVLQIDSTWEATARVGQEINIPKSDKLHYAQVYINYTMAAKLKRLLYQPPPIMVSFIFENGEKETFRAIKPILEGGVLLNKYIYSSQEFELLMLTGGRLNTTVKMIRFDEDSNSKGLVESIRLVHSLYRYVSPEAQKIKDSISLDALMAAYEPIQIDPAGLNTEPPFRYGIDVFNSHSPFITMGGWAFKEDINNKKAVVHAVLRSNDHLFQLPTKPETRADLPYQYNRKDVVDMGFSGSVTKTALPPGDYQLGILLENKADGKKWLTFSPHHLFVKSEYQPTKISRVEMNATSGSKMDFFVESVKDIDEGVQVQGWAFVKNSSTPATAFLVLQGKESIYRINTDPVNRLDLVGKYKTDAAAFAGFSVIVPREKIDRGVYTIGIEEDVPGKGKFYSFSTEQVKIGMSEVSQPALLAETPRSVEMKMGIDEFTDGKEELAISGWAVYKKEETQVSSIDIVLKGPSGLYTAETIPHARPDITAQLGAGYDQNESGFVGRISKKDLPKGTYEVGIRVYRAGQSGVVKFTGQKVIK